MTAGMPASPGGHSASRAVLAPACRAPSSPVPVPVSHVQSPRGSPGSMPLPSPPQSPSVAASPLMGTRPPPSPKRSGSGETGSTIAPCGDDQMDEDMVALCRKIDTDGSGTISELELLAAVRAHPDVAAILLPGKAETIGDEQATFDIVDELFGAISGGKQRLRYGQLIGHIKRQGSKTMSGPSSELRRLYLQIDGDGDGSVSKLELYEAVRRSDEVARIVLHGKSCVAASDEETFDEVRTTFEAIAGGKKRFEFTDFEAYFRHEAGVGGPAGVPRVDRASKRVFIIGPGFGRQMNPRQSQLIEESGYQVHWCWENLPNPETPNFDVRPYLDQIRRELADFQPDVVCCASKGGAYIASLWLNKLWCGPTLLINAHPCCGRIPDEMPVVLCQGSNDEVYPTPRSRLEEILRTGNPDKCFLYYTANSGLLPTGHYTRYGDQHNMASLQTHGCLTRLIDGLLSPEGPELHMVRTWRDRLTDSRLESEAWLGYSPESLRRHWVSRGRDEHKLHDVPRNSEEFARIHAVFKAQPKEPPAYALKPPEEWERVQVLNVQRIENAPILDGCSMPYYNSLARAIEDQEVAFEPGVHTSWAFHGADANAIDSIVNNVVAGFQPLASGTRGASLWGSGTYFARDARYVADGGFCGQPAIDGTRRMLACLLMSGIPCLGDPQHKGVLPFRKKPHRYNSSVDCLASPEIYITQQSGAAHAAYLITFR